MEPRRFAFLKSLPYFPQFCEGSIPRHDSVEIGRIRGEGNLGKKKTESHKSNMRGPRPSMKGKKKTESHINNMRIDPLERTTQQQKNYENNQKAKKARERRAAEEPAAKKQRTLDFYA